MRAPGRLRFRWTDDTTLRLDIDSGTRTRLLRFDAEADAGEPGERSRQGRSIAHWNGSGEAAALIVTTTGLRPGYLRRNGVPYSGNPKLFCAPPPESR